MRSCAGAACSRAFAGARSEAQSDMTQSCWLERPLQQKERESSDRGIGSRALGAKHRGLGEAYPEYEAHRMDACGCKYHYKCQEAQERVHSRQEGQDMGPWGLSWDTAGELCARKDLEPALAGAVGHMHHKAVSQLEVAPRGHRQYERVQRRALSQKLA